MIVLLLLIILGTLFQGLAMFRTGLLYDFGIGYWGPLARDGVWHEALAKALLLNIPPFNPGLSGTALANYHYFYDFLVALLSRLGMPAGFLIYRFFPVVFSILLGIGTYKLAREMFKDKKTSIIAVFLAYFASSFGWIVSLIKGEEIGGESAFWANQPVSMNLNPPYAISLVMIIFSFLLIHSFVKKPKLLKAVAIVILAGTIIGFKVYAGVVLLGALFALGIKRLLLDRDYKLIVVAVFSLLVAAAIFIPQSKSSAALIEFKPFWLIDTMIDAGDRVGIPNFTSRRFAYLAEAKWIHLTLLESLCFLIFFAGNLGTRILGFWGVEKRQLKSDLFLLIFAAMIVSFVPPLLFIQKGNTWNIVQFFYYFLFFSGLFASYAFAKLPKIALILLLVITPISSVASFRGWIYPTPPAALPKAEYEALKFLEVKDPGTVLKYPFNEGARSAFRDPYPLHAFADNAYVSAYSGHQVFLEDVEQQIVLNTDYTGRLGLTKRFFIEKDLSWSNKFLKDNKIGYIYLPKVYQLPMAEQEYLMDKIFENDGVNIYKVR